MRKLLLLLILLANLTASAQSKKTIYGSDIRIVYMSKEDFNQAYLEFIKVKLLPTKKSKKMKREQEIDKQNDREQSQVKISSDFTFGQIESYTFEERILQLENFIQNNPERIYNLIIENEELKRIETIGKEHIVETSLLDNAKDFNQLFNKAADLYESSDYDEALELIDMALKMRSTDLESIYLKCYILIQQKNFPQLIETATLGIAEEPEDARFYDIRGSAYYFDFQPQLALKDYRKMLELDNSDARYYNNYMQLLSEQQMDVETKSVFETYEKAEADGLEIKSKKYEPEIYFYYAQTLERKGENVAAIEMLTKAIQLTDTSAKFYSNRSTIYEKQSDHQKALIDINKAIKLKDDIAGYYVTRYEIYYNTKQYELARKDLQKALSIDEGTTKIYVGLGNIYQIQGKQELAIDNFNIALKDVPNDADILSNCAYSYFEIGNIDKALELWKKALSIQPNEIDILIGLAVAYKQQDNESSFSKMTKLMLQNTKYTAKKDLLNELMKDNYYYTPKFKTIWESIVK